jgi:hypothetical protein
MAGQENFIPIPESLSTEVKGWIDPRTPHGKALIVKACIALYNHGGGVMRIGFDNLSGAPVKYSMEGDVPTIFAADLLQKTVSEYCSDRIPLQLEYKLIDGGYYPIVTVPGGVRRPVCSTKSITVVETGKMVLADNRVYIRTVDSNDVFSSSEPRSPRDWEDLVSRCADNREADVARFIRRHFTEEDLGQLRELILGGGSGDAAGQFGHEQYAFRDHGDHYMADGYKRLEQAMERNPVELPKYGFFEVAAFISGNLPHYTADDQLYKRLMAANPGLTAFPAWLDTRHARADNAWAKVVHNAWETFLYDKGDRMHFGVLYETDAFYQLRSYQEDTQDWKLDAPAGVIAFQLQIRNVAEIIFTLLRFTEALRGDVVPFSIGVKFHWAKLRGRRLINLTPRGAAVLMSGPAEQDDVGTAVNLPWDLPADAIHNYVGALTKDLFKIFDGKSVPSEMVAQYTNELIHRQ